MDFFCWISCSWIDLSGVYCPKVKVVKNGQNPKVTGSDCTRIPFFQEQSLQLLFTFTFIVYTSLNLSLTGFFGILPFATNEQTSHWIVLF